MPDSKKAGNKRKFNEKDKTRNGSVEQRAKKKTTNPRTGRSIPSQGRSVRSQGRSVPSPTSSEISVLTISSSSLTDEDTEDTKPNMRDVNLNTATLLEALEIERKSQYDRVTTPLKLHNAINMWGGMEEGKNDEQEIVGVLGSGDYGRAIAGKIAQSGYTVLIGSRDPTNPAILEMLRGKTGTRLVTQDEAARSADIIVVAVGSDHYKRLPLFLLKNKIVVDVANRTEPPHPREPSMAEDLQSLIPQSQVVKAFNVLSAYALENNVQQGAKQVPVASDHGGARRRVIEMVKKMGYMPVDRGRLKAAREIEAIPLQLMPSWKKPLMVVGGLWILHYLILLFKYQICESIWAGNSWSGDSLKHLALLNINRTSAITSLWTLTLCYLPGVGAAYLQLSWGTKYRRFPSWLDTWLKMRKQLGLLMMWLAAIHTILGCAVWSGRYDALVWEAPTFISAEVKVNDTYYETKEIPIHNNMMSLQGELFLTFGTLSMFITFILGVSSLPSVGATLTWREFTFIQSKLGWVALITGTLHDGLLGWGFAAEDYSGCSLPSGAQYALLFPLATIALKLPLLLPCVDGPLQKIRKGYDRNKTITVYPSEAINPLDMTRRKREERGIWNVQQRMDTPARPHIIMA